MGRHSLQENIATRNINYIKYVESKGPLSLVKQAADYEALNSEDRNSFYSIIKKWECTLPNHNIRTICRRKLNKLVKEEFNTTWKIQVASFSKADTYRLFKDDVKFENYLSDIKSRKHRVTFAKYRLSDHCLMVEKGRHKRPIIPRNQRFCSFCPTKIEDAIHFLTQCSLYKNRNLLYMAAEAVAPNFITLNAQAQFIFLMSQEDKMLNRKLIYKLHEWFSERLEYNIN